MIKKKIIAMCVIISILVVCCVGCTQQEIHSGIPDYFIEPEGYVIAEVYTVGHIPNAYGYIKNEDYANYQTGQLESNLVVLHPYEHNKSYTVDINSVGGIVTGKYKDIR